MVTTTPSPSDPTRDLDRLESILLTAALEESSGHVTLVQHAEWGPLYLRKGQTYLSKAKALEIIPAVQPADLEDSILLPGVAEASKRRLLLAILRSLPSVEAEAKFTPGNPPASAAPFIGPLPTHDLAQECRVFEVEDSKLLERLGGAEVWLETRLDAPALTWLSNLGGDAPRWVSRLAEPDALHAVLRSSKDRSLALQAISRLHALEILRPRPNPRTESDSDERRRSEGKALVPRDTLKGFRERIRESLADVPLGVDQEQHRSEVAEMIAASGGADHYELLGIPVNTLSDEVIGPYRQLARLVHPDHAEALDLVGGLAALEVLFERATQAYLVLSDPDRRKAYDLEIDLSASQIEERSAEEITESRQRMAKRSYQEARRQLQAEDYHYAHEHCQIAVQNDPQPEYLALLGEIQSHNPKWLGDAAASLLRALELKPNEPIFLYQLASVYEKMGNDQAALKTYEAVIERMSNHPGALDGIERLRGAVRTANESGLKATLRRWFSGG